MCDATDDPVCHQLHSCQACTSHPYCHWDFTQNRCQAVANLTIGESQVLALSQVLFFSFKPSSFAYDCF